MKTILLAGASSLALWASNASAATIWTAPATGAYQIIAYGAQGGAGCSDGPCSTGGLGAEMGGDIELTAGTDLYIVEGAMGSSCLDCGAGGGGASWVYLASGPTPLLIAGGGGGGGFFSLAAGGPGLTGLDGGAGMAGGGSGGTGGFGGEVSGDSGAGSGWLSPGQSASLANDKHPQGTGGYGAPFFSGGFSDGFVGPGNSTHDSQVTGGAGGGGGAGYTGGGGGGGYSGGGAGMKGGGGGGSYISGAFSNTVEIAGQNAGDGLVSITALAAVPEPSTWSLLITGFGFLGFLLRRRFLGRPVRA